MEQASLHAAHFLTAQREIQHVRIRHIRQEHGPSLFLIHCNSYTIMNIPIKRLFVNGLHNICEGSGTELLHQICVWRKMGLEVPHVSSRDCLGTLNEFFEIIPHA